MTRTSVVTFGKCLALSIFGMGVLSAVECPTATLDQYIALGKAGCTITATTLAGGTAQLTFSQFTFIDFGIGLQPTNLKLTPLKDLNGIGFQIEPVNVAWTASSFHRVDNDVQYIATVTMTASDFPGIDRLYTELNGSATPPGFDVVTEVYCPGGFTLPPDQTCPGTNGQAQTLYVGPTAPAPQGQPGSGTTKVFNTALFAPGPHGTCNAKGCVYSSIALDKDMDANATQGGNATITLVKNQFGPPVGCTLVCR
jgi:hypothetical protein